MTKIKICGITNVDDALVAAESGADFLGFIFYEPSPRYIKPEVAREIVTGIRGQGASGESRPSMVEGQSAGDMGTRDGRQPLFVGVFVNSPLETVTRLLDFCQLDAAQLHGEESPEFIHQLRGRAFKALRPQSAEEAETLIQRYHPGFMTPPTFQPTNLPAHQPSNLPTSLFNLPTFLLDAYHPALYGGTGQVADWSMAAHIAQRYPIMLAGSLTPANVAEAIRAVHPWGVDVSSGVELEKRRKEPGKVRAFVEAVRTASWEAA